MVTAIGMKCPECNYEIPDDARFCASCGVEIGGICSGCQTPLLTNARFCHKCGAKREAAPDSVTEAVTQPAKEKSATAERRQLTVMFCDLVGSTALSEQLDPEELRELVIAYQKVCADVVEAYGGYISRLMGDGILVLLVTRKRTKTTLSGVSMRALKFWRPFCGWIRISPKKRTLTCTYESGLQPDKWLPAIWKVKARQRKT